MGEAAKPIEAGSKQTDGCTMCCDCGIILDLNDLNDVFGRPLAFALPVSDPTVDSRGQNGRTANGRMEEGRRTN